MFWFTHMMPLLAQAAATTTPPAGSPWYLEPWFELLATVALLVGPYLFGNFLARRMRMNDYGWKIGLIFTTLTVGLVINVLRGPPTLGIDLRGGVKLIYQLDESKLQSVNINDLVSKVAAEVKTSGRFSAQSIASSRLVVPLSEGRIQITLPTVEPQRVADVEDGLAKLSLGTLASSFNRIDKRIEGKTTVLIYQAQRRPEAVDMDLVVTAISKRVNPGGQREVAIRRVGAQQIEVAIPNVDPAEIEYIKKKIATAGALEFRIVANTMAAEDSDAVEAAQHEINNPADDVSNGQRIVARWAIRDPKVTFNPRYTRPLTRELKPGEPQVLILLDDYNVTGGDLSDAKSGIGNSGPEVEFRMTDAGSKRMGELTGNNLPRADGSVRELAIVLDGTLMSAATIQGHITSEGQITGTFTEDDVKFIVDVLNAGRLPAALEKQPVSEERISPEMGRDTIRASAQAMIVSTVAVLAFMLFYYRFAGIVADLSVLFNLLLVVALMILVKAPFTLAGLAGLVLSVGMAVDSNVLIYERMREEKERGAALRMVIRNGFGRAMATIIDTHSTTIITGVVLFLIGTEQLKGFAVTLVLGLGVNLFTAVFAGRVVFDVAERKRWLKELKMLKLFGETNIDFVRYMKPAISISILISVLGIVCAYMRGKELFGTDFTGGSEVQLAFKADLKSPPTDAEVRKKVDSLPKVLTDPTVQFVTGEGTQGLQFNITTSNEDTDQVKAALTTLFHDQLQFNSVEPVDLRSAAPAAKSGVAPPGGEKPKTGAIPQLDNQPLTPEKPKAAEPAKAPEAPKTDTAPKAPEPPKSDDKSKSPEPTKTDEKPKTDAAPSKSTDGKSSAISPGRRSTRSLFASAVLGLWLTVDQSPLLLAADSPPTPAAAAKSDAPAAAPAKAGAPKSDAAKTDAAKTEPPKTETPKSDAPKTDAGTTVPSQPESPKTDLNPGSAAIGPSPTGGFGTGAPAAVDLFVGGSQVTLKFAKAIKFQSVKSMLEQVIGKEKIYFEISNPKYVIGSADARGYDTWILKLSTPPEKATPYLTQLKDLVAKTPVFLGDSHIGGRVAGDTQVTAFYALAASILMIVVYIWVRFQNVIYGLGAVVALIHDVVVTVAALALSAWLAPYFGSLLVEPFKISLNVVAALLTICGYSISDTIVIFDRIREVRGKSPELTEEMVNVSVNQTLSRTVLTVFTVLLVTTILYISGGQAIHAFAFTMLIGLISGTYSSVYIAAPILLWLRGTQTQRRSPRIE